MSVRMIVDRMLDAHSVIINVSGEWIGSFLCYINKGPLHGDRILFFIANDTTLLSFISSS